MSGILHSTFLYLHELIIEFYPSDHTIVYGQNHISSFNNQAKYCLVISTYFSASYIGTFLLRLYKCRCIGMS